MAVEALAREFHSDGTVEIELLENNIEENEKIMRLKMFDPENIDCARNEFSRGEIVFWREYGALIESKKCVYDLKRLESIKRNVLAGEKEKRRIIDLLRGDSIDVIWRFHPEPAFSTISVLF